MHARHLLLLVFLLGTVVPKVHSADMLDEIVLFARAGTPAMALRLMDRNQPSAGADPGPWQRWERARIDIYRSQGDWPAIMARADALPGAMAPGFAAWLRTQAVAAALALRQGEQARRRLMVLIWDGSPDALSRYLPQWRRMVIRSYLIDGRVQDAQTAMLRYQLDYGDGGDDWRLLRARVLLRAGRPAEAAAVLSRGKTAGARVLSLLARSRAGTISFQQARGESKPMLDGGKLDAALAYRLWATLAEAGQKAGNAAGTVDALEHALSFKRRAGDPDGLVSVRADTLWDAYAAYAQRLANRRQLLVGSFADWLSLAARLARRHPLDARALYAYLVLHADSAARRKAATRLVDLLSGDPERVQVLRQLFLESRHFVNLEAVPEPARRVLVDQAIAEGDTGLASRLMSGLTQAPAGADPLRWQLRRARVLILGGHHAEGVQVLRDLAEQPKVLEGDGFGRLTRVLLELANLGENQDAYDLFARLLAQVADPGHQRELLSWMADSRAAQQRYEEAALLYLKSAILPDVNSMDPRARTARYHAAEMLGKANLKSDARSVYRGLLGVTKEPARRAALERAIQELRLKPDEPGD